MRVARRAERERVTRRVRWGTDMQAVLASQGLISCSLHRSCVQILDRIRYDTEFMDTVVLHHKPQRFKTKDLERKLHHYYFTGIVRDIATRAEAIAVERQTRVVSEQLTDNFVTARVKTAQLGRLKTKFNRSERMRLKRSALNLQLFPKNRRKVLRRVWDGWMVFLNWRRGVKKNYQVQFQVKQNELTLASKEKQRRHLVEQTMHGLSKRENPAAMALSDEDRIYTAGGLLGREVPHVARTVMNSHNRRHAKCRNCKQECVVAC